jgi:tRNA A37 N6-isopentenylltransferase MiaA
LGAVNIETGHYEQGRSWYAKAVERGYNEESVDDELRRIFFTRIDKSKQEALRKYLLTIDPERYSWARKKVPKKATRGKSTDAGQKSTQ